MGGRSKESAFDNAAGQSMVKAVGPAGNTAVSVPEKAAEVFEDLPAWWRCCLLFLCSGISWVASIPILMVSLGGSMAPHLGWIAGVCTAIAMFCVLVQVDQRIAAATVTVVSFTSASFASQEERGLTVFWALVASSMTMLNGIHKLCPPCPRILSFQCRHFKGYHRRCELRGALDTMRPGGSFYACHPHGILSIGWISNIVWGSTFHRVAGRCLYLIDGTLRNKGLLARLWCDAFEGPHGGLRDTSSASMKSLMSRRESVAMIPGAYQEATLFSQGRDRVALMQRKGFVKYCLRYGYRLHPVYSFGESETYRTLGGFEQFRLWLNKFGIPTVAFWGLLWCPLLPRTGVNLLTYVGPPLELPQIAEPTPQEVDHWHAKYVEALRDLFNKNKAEAGYPHAELEVL